MKKDACSVGRNEIVEFEIGLEHMLMESSVISMEQHVFEEKSVAWGIKQLQLVLSERILFNLAFFVGGSLTSTSATTTPLLRD